MLPLLGQPQPHEMMLFAAMAQIERLQGRKRSAHVARARGQPFKDRPGVALESVRMKPHPFVRALAPPQVRLTSRLAVERELSAVNDNRPAEACIKIRRADV